MEIRLAEARDIPGMIQLLYQVGGVHHDIRPDIFRSGAIKYTPEDLEKLLKEADKPIFVYDDEGFYRSYLAAIDSIRAIQPNAIIYIQGLIPINEGEIAASGGNTDLTNEHLRVYNDLMRKAAQEKQVVYLDLYTEFVDENGELPQGASRDGVHLKKDYCKRWLTYLQTHTVDPAALEMGVTEIESEENVPA